jgi:hypothetical protein
MVKVVRLRAIWPDINIYPWKAQLMGWFAGFLVIRPQS